MYEEYSNVRTLFSLCCSLFPVQLGKDKSGSHDDKLDSVGDLPTEQTLCAVCRCIMRAKATSLKLFTSRPCQSALCAPSPLTVANVASWGADVLERGPRLRQGDYVSRFWRQRTEHCSSFDVALAAMWWQTECALIVLIALFTVLKLDKARKRYSTILVSISLIRSSRRYPENVELLGLVNSYKLIDLHKNMSRWSSLFFR